MNWHLYVVRTVDDTLYAGVAVDIERRYREHCAAKSRCAKYLRAHRPAALVFSRKIGSRSQALKEEYRFKQLSRREKELVIAGKGKKRRCATKAQNKK